MPVGCKLGYPNMDHAIPLSSPTRIHGRYTIFINFQLSCPKPRKKSVDGKHVRKKLRQRFILQTCQTLRVGEIFAPENGWLEDDPGLFSGAFAIGFREGHTSWFFRGDSSYTSFWLSIFKRCFNKECKTLFTGYLRTICRSNVLSFLFFGWDSTIYCGVLVGDFMRFPWTELLSELLRFECFTYKNRWESWMMFPCIGSWCVCSLVTSRPRFLWSHCLLIIFLLMKQLDLHCEILENKNHVPNTFGIGTIWKLFWRHWWLVQKVLFCLVPL